MYQTLSDQDQTILAVAAVTACVAKSLVSAGVIVPADFDRHLQNIHRQISAGANPIGALKALGWLKEMMRA